MPFLSSVLKPALAGGYSVTRFASPLNGMCSAGKLRVPNVIVLAQNIFDLTHTAGFIAITNDTIKQSDIQSLKSLCK